jgi:hypothetical protein
VDKFPAYQLLVNIAWILLILIALCLPPGAPQSFLPNPSPAHTLPLSTSNGQSQ